MRFTGVRAGCAAGPVDLPLVAHKTLSILMGALVSVLLLLKGGPCRPSKTLPLAA